MSVETYSSYEVSPAERERIERERQRRLEEERKRQEEELRQRQVADQKTRVSYAKNYEEFTKRLEIGKVRDRLVQLEARTADLSANRRRQELTDRIAEMQSLLDRGADPSVLMLEVSELEKTASDHGSVQSMPDSGPTTEQAQQLLLSVRSALDLIAQHDPSRAGRITRIISAAERELPANHVFHHSKLKEAEFELLHLVQEAAKLQKKRQLELDRFRGTIDDWIPRLRALQRCVVLEQDRARASELATQFEHLKSAPPLQGIEEAVQRLAKDSRDLESESREADVGHFARAHVLAAVELSLTEMGYDVEILTDPANMSTPELKSIIAYTSDDCVVGTFGLNKDIHFHFKHAIEPGQTEGLTGQEELAERCKTWCQDETELLDRLREQGIAVKAAWAKPPGQTEIPVQVVDKRPKRAAKTPRRRTELPKQHRSEI